MVVALLLSGGSGLRVASDVPKQYIPIQGRMLIGYTLDALCGCKKIDAVQVVAEQSWHEAILAAFPDPSKCKGFSMPGETRQFSILNGLRDIKKYADGEDVVIIHDAARPLVSIGLIERTLDAVEGRHGMSDGSDGMGHDGAVPVLPLKDTVYYSEDGTSLTKNLKRSKIVAGQAPEAFRLGKYLAANESLSHAKLLQISGSAEPAVMAGLDVVTLQGEEKNYKITTMEDLERFSDYMSTQKDAGKNLAAQKVAGKNFVTQKDTGGKQG